MFYNICILYCTSNKTILIEALKRRAKNRPTNEFYCVRVCMCCGKKLLRVCVLRRVRRNGRDNVVNGEAERERERVRERVAMMEWEKRVKNGRDGKGKRRENERT